MVIDPIKFLGLTNSVHEGVQNSIITSGILDLSDSSEAIQDISAESLEQVVGQEKAKGVLKNILEEVISGVHIKKDGYNKPIASMIFAGPSGVGKTLLARVTQQILNNHYNNKIEIIKINCADFAGESVHGLTRLIGASAGYMGSDKKPLLHPQNVHGQGRVILFDEIEKAGPTFWNLLLSILDDGTLDINYFQKDSSKTSDKTSPVLLGASEEVSDTTSLKTIFGDSVIIMTSNVGNDTVEKELSGSGIGFGSSEKQPDEVDVEAIILQEFAKQFRIEMQGRFDYIVPFEHLTKENAKDIIDQLINRLITNTLSKGNGFVIEFSDSAKERILEEICSSKDFRKFGGRAIEGYFKKQILPYVARAINSGKFREEDTHSCLLVTEHNQKIVFSKIPIGDIESTKAKVSDIMTNS